MAKKSSSSGNKQTKKVVKTAKKLHKTNPKIFYAIVALIVIAAIAVGVLYALRPDLFKGKMPATEGELIVRFIDVGQGDCIYIQFPDGKDMLIDCGSEGGSNANRDAALADLEELVADDALDYLMLTHADMDHVAYMDEVLETFAVANIYMPNIKAVTEKEKYASAYAALPAAKLNKFTDEDTIGTDTYVDFFIAALTEPNANIVLNVGDFEISGEDYTFDFWCFSAEDWANNDLSSAEKKNAISPIGILEYAGRRVVFTGDSNEMNEEMYLENNLIPKDCDVLKVGHHGSETSSTRAFLDFINCEYAVISVGEGNKYGHPTTAALGRFEEDEMQVYRTDLYGNVTLAVDNTGNMAFSTEKQIAA